MNKTTQTSSNKPALGKGLASLLSNASLPPTAKSLVSDLSNLPKPPPPQGMAQEEISGTKDRIPGISLVDVEAIIPNQFQPRRDFDQQALSDLATSIAANGIIQPLVVRKSPEGKFLLIAGERRLRAAKLAGLKQVPVVVRKSGDKEALEIALVENIQREDLNCVDVALSYFQLMEDFRLTQEEVAVRVGKDRATVANHLRLLKLPEAFITDLRTGKLSFGHGKALLSIADPLKRDQIRQKVLAGHLSVRETEKLIAQELTGTAKQKVVKEQSPQEHAVQEELSDLSERIKRALGSRVFIKGDEKRGTIQIEYFSRDDLQRLSEKFLS